MAEELRIFEGNKIRSYYDDEKEHWYFSIIDIISILTESKNPRRYWSDLKIKLADDEGFSQLYEKIVQLKLKASDGKKYATDCTDVETLLRIIQIIQCFLFKIRTCKPICIDFLNKKSCPKFFFAIAFG